MTLTELLCCHGCPLQCRTRGEHVLRHIACMSGNYNNEPPTCPRDILSQDLTPPTQLPAGFGRMAKPEHY